MRWVLLLAALVGCATAHHGNVLDQQPDSGVPLLPDSSAGGRDASPMPDVAPMPDAAPAPDAAQLAITVSETTDSTVATSGSITCAGGDGTSSDNTWYRAFQLSDYPMITGTFHITSVTFGAQQVSAATGVTVAVGSYTGAVGGSTIDTAQISPLANAPASIPNTEAGEAVNTPIAADIPAGGKFVVEIVAPSLEGSGYFYIGATTTGSETHPGYISSSACGVAAPETTVAAGGTGRIIINVNGTY